MKHTGCFVWGILLLCQGAAFAKCPPAFYSKLPKDSEWYYGVGNSSSPDAARGAAVRALQEQAVGSYSEANAWLVSGWEQNHSERCEGITYIMVRAKKAEVKKLLISAQALKLREMITGDAFVNREAITNIKKLEKQVSGLTDAIQSINASPNKQHKLAELRQLTAIKNEEDEFLSSRSHLSEISPGYGESVLGDNYAYGVQGFPQDDKKAVEHYKKAAELGDNVAQMTLANWYWHGTGVKEDRAEACKWWKKALDTCLKDANHCYAGMSSVKSNYETSCPGGAASQSANGL